MRADEMGQIKPGNLADCILVDGDPLDNIKVLQDHDKLNIVLINGRVHKAARSEYVSPAVAGSGNTALIREDFPEVKPSMQKDY